MQSQPLVSIIIRTKNEERWIKLCLDKIYEQSYKNFEIIIVDNYSSDKTLQKIKNYKINKIVKIKKYLPGKAINLGIKKSQGEYIVIISAHCIPTTKNWLKNFVQSINNKKNNFAGVYGRQEPMNFSSSNDKRDMFLLFGLDKKIQKKDSFFHNANSCIKKSVWKKHPFDEKISNIEDRLWGQEIIKNGYSILYEPNSSVFHYHGIHQNNNFDRLSNVVRIVDKQIKQQKGKINPFDLNVVAVIPIKGICKKINNNYLLESSIKSLVKSKYVKKIIVSTDNITTKKVAIRLGAEVPFLRIKKYSNPETNLETVQQYTLFKLEEKNIIPDLFLHLEETFPFRENGLIDKMIEKIVRDGLDSVVAARREVNWVWKDKNDKIFKRVDSGDVPRKFKEFSIIGCPGLACITYPEFIRRGHLTGKNLGLYEINNHLSFFEVRDKNSYQIAHRLLSNFKTYFSN